VSRTFTRKSVSNKFFGNVRLPWGDFSKPGFPGFLHKMLFGNKALTNQSASQFIRSLRLQRAVELLKQKAGTVAEIACLYAYEKENAELMRRALSRVRG